MEKAELRAKYDEDMWVINLSEVEVTASRIEKKEDPRLLFWANAVSATTVSRVEIEKYQLSNQKAKDILVMLVPGVFEIGGGIHIRSSRTTDSPLVLIDGFERENALELSANVIESIDVFKGPSAAAFGMRGAYGVINITTRRGENSPLVEKPNHTIYTSLGYQKPVEFYSPKYETLDARQSLLPDYRTTIFWKPDIVISDSEEASFEFYTSDFPTTYSVVIEGLTIDGRIIRQVEIIKVE